MAACMCCSEAAGLKLDNSAKPTKPAKRQGPTSPLPFAYSFPTSLATMSDSSSLEPKRIVILFRSRKSDAQIAKAFLQHSSRPDSEFERNVHYIHFYPDRDDNGTDWFHLVFDLNAQHHSNVDPTTVPLEIYKAKEIGDDGPL